MQFNKYLLIATLAGVLLSANNSKAQVPFRIGVDPGHGGTDSGAVGPTGLTEKEINLTTALALRKYLQADGATVFITRTTDATVSLTSRSNYFISNAVNRAISVHHNSGGSTNKTMDFVYCARCFTTAGNLASSVIQRVGSSAGLALGPAVSTADVLCSGRSDWSCGRDGVGQANLHMVREPELGAQIPSILVEVSFISNSSEEARLKSGDYLDSNGWSIYAGVADHFGVAPKPRNGCAITVGQGTSGSELTAFQNAYNNAGGQGVLGCATAGVRFDGFTSFAGTIGHFQTFTNGEIEYLVNGNRLGQAYGIKTALYNKWSSFGFNNNNPLGYPIGNLTAGTPSCAGTSHEFQSYEGGSLTHHLNGARSGSVYEVHGAIHSKWSTKGFASCPLGLPLSDESDAQPSGATARAGRLNQFEGGQIYWIKNGPLGNAQPAYEVHGAIYSTYVGMGGSPSWLGFPTSDEYVASTGYPRNDFEGGYITTTDGVNYRAFPYGTSSLTINLGTGWNLISLPLQPSNTAITNVLSNISGKYSAVWAWDGPSQSWRSYFPTNPGFANLSSMDAGKGYWIYMTSSGSLPVSGSTPSKTINLVSQWNLVGYNSTTSNSVTSALSSIAGRYVSVWAWDYSTTSYQSYFPNNQLFSDLTTMDTGRGYWIYATQNTSWTIP